MLTNKDLERLQAQGKIKGFKVTVLPKPLGTRHRRPAGAREKMFIDKALQWYSKESGAQLEREFKFDPGGRQWRFDWCLVDQKIAVEYEGIMSHKSRHTTVGGFSADTTKYNAAAAAGFTVLRYTCMTYKNITQDLKNQVTNESI